MPKKVTKKTLSTKKRTTRKSKVKKEKEDIHDLHKVFRRKHIICHTCKNRNKCEDALTKKYPFVCMIYVADETLEKNNGKTRNN